MSTPLDINSNIDPNNIDSNHAAPQTSTSDQPWQPVAGPSVAGYSRIPTDVWQTQLGSPGWFIVAEAALNPDIRTLAEQHPTVEQCLYWGEMGKIHSSISPHIMTLESWDWFKDNIAYQPQWGIAVQLDPAFHHLPLERQFELVMRHLRAWTLVDYPGQERAILRITDWSIFGVLWQSSESLCRHHLRGPLGALAYWDPSGEAVEMLTFDTPVDPALSDSFTVPIVLTDRQFQALTVWGSRQQYRAYQTHLQTHHPETQSWEQGQFDDYLYRNLTQAEQLEFDQPQDVVRYLSLTVVLGEDFAQATGVKKILSAPHYKGSKNRMDRLFEYGLAASEQGSEKESPAS